MASDAVHALPKRWNSATAAVGDACEATTGRGTAVDRRGQATTQAAKTLQGADALAKLPKTWRMLAAAAQVESARRCVPRARRMHANQAANDTC